VLTQWECKEDLIRSLQQELSLTYHEAVQFLEGWRTLLEEIWEQELEWICLTLELPPSHPVSQPTEEGRRLPCKEN